MRRQEFNGKVWVLAVFVSAIALATVASVLPPSAPEAQALQVAGRDPLSWPFPWDSVWNMPIGSDANYVDAQIEPGRDYGVFADEDIIILDPTAPLVNVIAHDAEWDPTRRRCSSVVQPREVHIADVPIPATFTTEIDNSGTPNAAAAILLPDGETVVQTQPLHVCGPGGDVVSQFRFPDDNLVTGDGRAGAHGGSSMSSIGGTIRVGELVPGGSINHALKVVIDSQQYTFFDGSDATPGYRWPAFTADFGAASGYGGSVPEVEMGSLLALPPSFDPDTLRTEPGRMIAVAMQNYGGYVVDSSGWDAQYFVTEFGPAGRVTDEFEQAWGWPFLTPQTADCVDETDTSCAWSKDMGDIFAGLSAVTNNEPISIGGPGTRRVACAPAFADGTGGAPASCSPGAAVVTCRGQVATQDMSNGASGIGTSARDVIVGTDGSDFIDGRGGNDVICARGGNDIVLGGDGDDLIDTGAGNDIARGNAGDDELVGSSGADRLLGGIGADVIDGGEGDDVVGGFGGSDDITAGPGDDVVFGGFGADVIDGGAGDDEIHGLVGNDTIIGGDGNDELDGDRGNDVIEGGAGNDTIRGGNANDALRGDDGDDDLSGGKADDVLSGGGGIDVCSGNREHATDTADATCETTFGVP